MTVRIEELHGRMRSRKGTLHACVQQTQSMTTLQICKTILLSGPSHKKQPSPLENVSRLGLKPCRVWLNNARRSSRLYEMCVDLMCERNHPRWMQQMQHPMVCTTRPYMKLPRGFRPSNDSFTVVDMHSAGQNPKSWLISRCSAIPTM